MERSDFKPNSAKSREGQHYEKKVEKVVDGTVVTKKKGEFHKLARSFISEDADNIGDYIWADVLVPAIKKAVSDMITNGVDMLFYGGNGNRKPNSPGSSRRYTPVPTAAGSARARIRPSTTAPLGRSYSTSSPTS